jgi:hypothetical protein
VKQRTHSDRTGGGRSLLAQALAGQHRLAPVAGGDRPPRGFCGIGVCLECETEIDGRIVRACLVAAPTSTTPASEGSA